MEVKEFRLGNNYDLKERVNNETDKLNIYFDSYRSNVFYNGSKEEVVGYLKGNSKTTLEEEVMKALNLPISEVSHLGSGDGWMILGLTVPGKYIKLLSGLPPDRKFKTLCHEIAHNLRPDITNEREIDRIGDSISGLVLDMMKNLDSRYVVRNSYN